MTESLVGRPRRSYELTLLVVAVAAAGLNLRTAITSLPPLFPDLQARLHLSSATLSLREMAGSALSSSHPDGVARQLQSSRRHRAREIGRAHV